VDDRQLSRHRQNRSFACCVSQLRRRAAYQCDHARSIDDGAFGLVMFAHTENGVLAAEPDAFDVDVVCEIPDLLGGVDGVCVVAARERDRSSESYCTLTLRSNGQCVGMS